MGREEEVEVGRSQSNLEFDQDFDSRTLYWTILAISVKTVKSSSEVTWLSYSISKSETVVIKPFDHRSGSFPLGLQTRTCRHV